MPATRWESTDTMRCVLVSFPGIKPFTALAEHADPGGSPFYWQVYIERYTDVNDSDWQKLIAMAVNGHENAYTLVIAIPAIPFKEGEYSIEFTSVADIYANQKGVEFNIRPFYSHDEQE